MHSRPALCAALCAAVVSALATTSAHAAPILISIFDYDFAIETDPTIGHYSYNGALADRLYTSHATADVDLNADVPSYRDFLKHFLPQPGTADGKSYTVWSKKGETYYSFGGLLDLSLDFGASDGPYTSGTDRLVSLTGASGHLTITGVVTRGTTPSPTTPEKTLIDIQFNNLSLVARPGDTVAKVTGEGKVLNLFDNPEYAGNQWATGLVTFDFGTDTPLFTNINYTPDATNVPQGDVEGYISGQTGVQVPEPASLALLGLGAMGLLSRRRK